MILGYKGFKGYPMRKRITKQELEYLCNMRNDGTSPDSFNTATGRSTYLIRMTEYEFGLIKELRKSKEEVKSSEPKAITFKPIRRLFFDIETRPMEVYTFEVGKKIFIPYQNIKTPWSIICICYKWEHEDEVHYLTWDKNQSDKEMLFDFIKIANTADVLVGHNSDQFDIKRIRTRCIYHRIPMFPKYRSFDTFTKSRSGFSFDSNSLNFIGGYLGLGEKMHHEGMPLWIKCVNGDKEALDTMVTYCMRDVVLLQDVYEVLEHYVRPEIHTGVLNGEGRHSCPICGCREINFVKTDVTTKGTIKRIVKCLNPVCNHTYDISNKAYMEYLSNPR